MDFEQQINEILQHMDIPLPAARRALQAKVFSEQREPQTGIYYWVPREGPDGIVWDVIEFWHSLYGKHITHYNIFSKYIVPELESTFGNFTTPPGEYLGLPRGRVGYYNNRKLYVIAHGECPIGYLDEQVARNFNLRVGVNAILDRWEHEDTNSDHVSSLSKLIGIDIQGMIR